MKGCAINFSLVLAIHVLAPLLLEIYNTRHGRSNGRTRIIDFTLTQWQSRAREMQVLTDVVIAGKGKKSYSRADRAHKTRTAIDFLSFDGASKQRMDRACGAVGHPVTGD
jgi:hypothetical protein